MKSWHITFFLVLLIITLATWNWYSAEQTREELIEECHGDVRCIQEINTVQSGQLELIKRETFRCNSNPQCADVYTLGANEHVKPNQHIFIPKTHDVTR